MSLGIFDNLGLKPNEVKEADNQVLSQIAIDQSIQEMLKDLNDEIGLKALDDELMT